ncbi:hypothetical protein HJG60_010166 [Phyllostomus discolor]|uniref:Uncharacterized protein n=1 Tax=Phyllostomus discolor TaxID=89673 RepID=A0A834EG78_9CHIR|nr:hypothetical protein HJG60_010166 [Phyllostomus discolor]
MDRVSEGLQGGANSVSQVDGASDIAPTVSSVALLGEGSEKRQWPLPAFLSVRKLSPSSLCVARHFSSSLCASGFPSHPTPDVEPVHHLQNCRWSEFFCHQLWFLQISLPGYMRTDIFNVLSVFTVRFLPSKVMIVWFGQGTHFPQSHSHT